MSTSVVFTKNGKKVTKDFRSYSEVVKYFQTEAAKLAVKEKALNQKYPELRSVLQEEMRECEGIAAFFQYFMDSKKTVRDDKTGNYYEVETR